jgi:hypothetical protein
MGARATQAVEQIPGYRTEARSSFQSLRSGLSSRSRNARSASICVSYMPGTYCGMVDGLMSLRETRVFELGRWRNILPHLLAYRLLSQISQPSMHLCRGAMAHATAGELLLDFEYPLRRGTHVVAPQLR